MYAPQCSLILIPYESVQREEWLLLGSLRFRQLNPNSWDGIKRYQKLLIKRSKGGNFFLFCDISVLRRCWGRITNCELSRTLYCPVTLILATFSYNFTRPARARRTGQIRVKYSCQVRGMAGWNVGRFCIFEAGRGTFWGWFSDLRRNAFTQLCTHCRLNERFSPKSGLRAVAFSQWYSKRRASIRHFFGPDGKQTMSTYVTLKSFVWLCNCQSKKWEKDVRYAIRTQMHTSFLAVNAS